MTRVLTVATLSFAICGTLVVWGYRQTCRLLGLREDIR